MNATATNFQNQELFSKFLWNGLESDSLKSVGAVLATAVTK